MPRLTSMCSDQITQGCKHGKVDQNNALVYLNHNFLVNGLKVVAKHCLNWISFHDDFCCCVEYSHVEKSS